jgi:polyisoprenoid-binding protein YceI
VLVEARSNVGTVAFGTTAVTGCVDVVVNDGGIDAQEHPQGRLRVPLETLRSGNALYDAELQTRLGVQRYPMVDVELQEAQALGDGHYRVTGTVALHGVTCTLGGGVVLTMRDGMLDIAGEEVIDIRDFDIELPSVLMLRIYPEVKVSLQLRARPDLAERGE